MSVTEDDIWRGTMARTISGEVPAQEVGAVVLHSTCRTGAGH
jgi:hypothetical protein